MKTFLALLDVFEFGAFENFTQLNLKEWSFDDISVYDIYRKVGASSNKKRFAVKYWPLIFFLPES